MNKKITVSVAVVAVVAIGAWLLMPSGETSTPTTVTQEVSNTDDATGQSLPKPQSPRQRDTVRQSSQQVDGMSMSSNDVVEGRQSTSAGRKPDKKRSKRPKRKRGQDQERVEQEADSDDDNADMHYGPVRTKP